MAGIEKLRWAGDSCCRCGSRRRAGCLPSKLPGRSANSFKKRNKDAGGTPAFPGGHPPWAPRANETAPYRFTVPPSLLTVTPETPRWPPTGSTAGEALVSPTPPQGGSDSLLGGRAFGDAASNSPPTRLGRHELIRPRASARGYTRPQLRCSIGMACRQPCLRQPTPTAAFAALP